MEKFDSFKLLQFRSETEGWYSFLTSNAFVRLNDARSDETNVIFFEGEPKLIFSQYESHFKHQNAYAQMYRVKTLKEKSAIFNFKPRMNVQNETKEFKSMHNKIPESSV